MSLTTTMAAGIDAIRAAHGESIVYTPTSGPAATFNAMVQRVQFDEGLMQGDKRSKTGIIVTHPKSITAAIDLGGTYTFESKTWKILDVMFQNAVVSKVRAIYTGGRQLMSESAERRTPAVFD